MKKQTRTYAALIDTLIVGKRSTVSMFYTHAIVVEVKTDVPPPFVKMDSRRFQVVAFSCDAHNAEKTRAYQARWHEAQAYCARVFVAPVVMIDKTGNAIGGVNP